MLHTFKSASSLSSCASCCQQRLFPHWPSWVFSVGKLGHEEDVIVFVGVGGRILWSSRLTSRRSGIMGVQEQEVGRGGDGDPQGFPDEQRLGMCKAARTDRYFGQQMG